MNNDKNPRILVITVNSWNSKVGDNTFSTLLDGYPKDNIASLFIREDEPDSKVCNKYFRISESAIIKSIIKPSTITGQKVDGTTRNDSKIVPSISDFYKNKKGILYYPKLMIREVIWALGKWKSEELKAFVDEFQPDIVLYEMSRYIHLNRIASFIVKRTGARGIGCFWDDTFTYKQEKSLGYKFFRFFQRNSIRSLAKSTRDYFAITPKTKKEADSFLGISCVVLTKPIIEYELQKNMYVNTPIRLLYTGNLGIGRLDTLKIVVDAISNDADFVLDIYTNTFLNNDEKLMIESSNSHLHEAVCQAEVFELQKNADVLLFLEDLSDDNLVARLSFSTKITDYYSAGKCILAAGNKDLAPMELLKESDSALIANTKEDIISCINKLKEKDIIQFYAERSCIVGNENHGISSVRKTFYDVLLR